MAEKLGIPFQTVDLSEQYKARIVDYMFDEYKQGRTPNPDVLCNREIKFDVFLDIALSLGADFVATGHYCQRATTSVNGKDIHHLLAGADPNKDQSYFLCQLTQAQLSKVLFPIGHLQKSAVREIAASQDLITADKKIRRGFVSLGKYAYLIFYSNNSLLKRGILLKFQVILMSTLALQKSLITPYRCCIITLQKLIIAQKMGRSWESTMGRIILQKDNAKD